MLKWWYQFQQNALDCKKPNTPDPIEKCANKKGEKNIEYIFFWKKTIFKEAVWLLWQYTFCKTRALIIIVLITLFSCKNVQNESNVVIQVLPYANTMNMKLQFPWLVSYKLENNCSFTTVLNRKSVTGKHKVYKNKWLADTQILFQISAQESRRKKKEYVDNLESRCESFSSENVELRKKVESLEHNNRWDTEWAQCSITVVGVD